MRVVVCEVVAGALVVCEGGCDGAMSGQWGGYKRVLHKVS